MNLQLQAKSLKSRINSIFSPKYPPNHADSSEVKRKGRIFSYFIGVVWTIVAVDTVYQFFLASTFQEQATQGYQQFYTYAINDIIFLVCITLVWWIHRWYPKLMSHIFLITLVVGAIFFFDVTVLNRVFIGLALPIIMAAFLIRPIYSFLYYILITTAYLLRIYQAGFSILDLEFSYTNFVALFILAVVAWLIAQSLDKALAETKALNQELDQRVRDRTRELAAALDREQTTAVRNKTILESIADGIIVFDAHQEVLIANPAANGLARQNLQSLNQTRLLDTIQPEARDALQAWLSGHPPQAQGNIRFDWHDKTLSANVAPVILPQGEGRRVDAGHVMVLRDFTREAQLERAKDLFLSTVSHELRTPMSAIQGYVELLLDLEQETLSKEGRQYLETINISIRQLLTLANELIDLSRLETGEIDLYCKWVAIETIVEDAVKIVQQEFTNRGLSLKTEIETALPKLYVDGRRILQILLNLFSNAYKYTPEGGVTIKVYQTEERVNVAITDTGAGIKAADQSNLFKRFFRANDRVIQKAGGTGLGLSISKGLTELHGGKLTVESRYGVGTTFTMSLPQNGTLNPSN